jgi:geranylgeranyl diphosphate synthase type II
MGIDIEGYLSENKRLVDEALESYLGNGNPSLTKLREAMRYSALAGGKRLRPILMIASCGAVGGEREKVLPVACALEMIHTYSLVHDDLPSMDDDALRRGIPTNHKVYGEATAILAGDALLTDAFSLIVNEGGKAGIDSGVLCEVVGDISSAAGSSGMIEGQAVDLMLTDTEEVSLEDVERMHTLKTGAMITVAVRTGGRIGGANGNDLKRLSSYGSSIGLAFQIIDDLLDIEGEGDLGKERGGDAKHGKSTYPEIAGIEVSKRKAAELTRNAILQLRDFDGRAEPLREIARYLGCRTF